MNTQPQVVKVDLKTTTLLPFKFPADTTAEYTIEGDGFTSKYRYPQEVAEAIRAGVAMGYVEGYRDGRYSGDLISTELIYHIYSVLMLDIKEGWVKLQPVLHTSLLMAGFTESQLKTLDPNRNIPEGPELQAPPATRPNAPEADIDAKPEEKPKGFNQQPEEK